jgi:hypothetical protein
VERPEALEKEKLSDGGGMEQLISRHAGFFSYDPEQRAYCMITIPTSWRDTPGPTWQLVAAMLRTELGNLVGGERAMMLRV